MIVCRMFVSLILNFYAGHGKSFEQALPPKWEISTEHRIKYAVSKNSEEYRSLVTNFNQTMTGKYSRIIKIERIQNERWYVQYSAHKREFEKRLKTDTEKRLYHGCPEKAANAIMDEGFNRSFAGVNGKFIYLYMSISLDAFIF